MSWELVGGTKEKFWYNFIIKNFKYKQEQDYHARIDSVIGVINKSNL